MCAKCRAGATRVTDKAGRDVRPAAAPGQFPPFKPQAWHVEVRGISEPVVVGAFVTRQAAYEYRDSYNAESAVIMGGDPPAYACLCDCPRRNCEHLL